MQGVGYWAAAKTFCYQQHIGEENIHPCCKKYLRNKSIDNSPSYLFSKFYEIGYHAVRLRNHSVSLG